MIDNGLGFALVPWMPALDRHLGRHVDGVAKESGEIEWSFGRRRGIDLNRLLLRVSVSHSGMLVILRQRIDVLRERLARRIRPKEAPESPS